MSLRKIPPDPNTCSPRRLRWVQRSGSLKQRLSVFAASRHSSGRYFDRLLGGASLFGLKLTLMVLSQSYCGRPALHKGPLSCGRDTSPLRLQSLKPQLRQRWELLYAKTDGRFAPLPSDSSSRTELARLRREEGD